MAEISLDTEKEMNAAEMKKPEARVSHVSLKDVSLEHVTYNAKVSLTNPFSTPVPILQISYALKTANREIASGTTLNSGRSIMANDEIVVDLEMEVPHSVLLSNLVRDIAADWDIDYELGINFVMNVHIDYELAINSVLDVPVHGNITIPICSQGQIKLPALSDISILSWVRFLLPFGKSLVIVFSRACLNVFDKVRKQIIEKMLTYC
ncbi:hypothetical protein ACET3Z_026421 [Daucus carota]